MQFTSQETLPVLVSCLSCCILNWSCGFSNYLIISEKVREVKYASGAHYKMTKI
jgi:hypothetical protein